MKEELQLAFNKLQQAYFQLRDGSINAKSQLEKDGVVQRFEFTFELMWKTIKIFLEHQGFICKTPRECMKSAFRLGLIKDEKTFLNMLEDRNKMSHLYDKAWADEILGRVSKEYIGAIEFLIGKFEAELKKHA